MIDWWFWTYLVCGILSSLVCGGCAYYMTNEKPAYKAGINVIVCAILGFPFWPLLATFVVYLLICAIGMGLIKVLDRLFKNGARP